MTHFMRRLRGLARTHHLLVLALNNSARLAPPNAPADEPAPPTRSVFSPDRKPALGPALPFLADGTLWLARWGGRTRAPLPDPEEVRVLEVLNTRFVPRRRWAPLRMKGGGVVGLALTEDGDDEAMQM
jgi:hypothetical protein